MAYPPPPSPPRVAAIEGVPLIMIRLLAKAFFQAHPSYLVNTALCDPLDANQLEYKRPYNPVIEEGK